MLNQQVLETPAKLTSRMELAKAERSARNFWVTLIVGCLGLQVAGGITAIFLAVSDPTVAIIPNYYDSAVNWDVTRRARELTQQLGWNIETFAGPTMESTGKRSFQVAIHSRNGKPVEGIVVSAKLYHHARGAEIYRLRLEEAAPGIYRGLTTLTKSGIWQIELQLEGDHGIAAESHEMVVK